ncbi:MAG: F0F1 ATP synthase subunit epsilon [Chloroflexi bacterium]|jgi:F-type H+-transporting ATPase subunit epsilon|nr:F0F1 ATP synthase subunit epsilon [Chloroflexota bacterium]
MAKLNLEIVTAERVVHSDEADLLVVPGVDGEMAILPSHAPLMTMLKPGELIVRKGSEDTSIFVSGGFFELMNDKVTILADSAERAEEIDLARAEEAKKRAEEKMELRAQSDIDAARAEAALRRSLMRLQVLEKRRSRR